MDSVEKNWNVVKCENLLSRSPPPLCIWTGCFPLLWDPDRWSPWGLQLSSSCPSSRPCSPQSSCSGRWWSEKPLWRAGGWKSSELWQSWLADLCCHTRTKETRKKQSMHRLRKTQSVKFCISNVPHIWSFETHLFRVVDMFHSQEHMLDKILYL